MTGSAGAMELVFSEWSYAAEPTMTGSAGAMERIGSGDDNGG